jgi:hypothetical protein
MDSSPVTSGLREDDMKEILINSWYDFIEQVENLQAERDVNAKHSSILISELLYRGQPDSSMKLETTLERSIRHQITLSDYYSFVYVIRAKIESITGKKWPIPSRDEFDKWLDEQKFPIGDGFPGDEYFAYLRHHGLPSPFLDWTRSPYVAAHFALTQQPQKEIQYSAIYVYQEHASGVKISDFDEPAISCLGPYLGTDRRHYLQQSEYTICTVGKGKSLEFASHETVVARDDKGQDLLWKLVIPISERQDFIEQIQRMNINPYSLFETEDSLMDDIYLSEIFLRKRL